MILIRGAGVAGSMLSLLLKANGVDHRIVDPWWGRYDKPCGEAVPVSTINMLPGMLAEGIIVHRIRSVVVCYNDRCREHDYGRTVGYIIDKAELVRRMRNSIVSHRLSPSSDLLKAIDHRLVVDARGPFSDAPEYDSLVVARGFTDDFDGSLDTIYMYFTDRFMGYFWVFPSSRTRAFLGYRWNVGIGLRSSEYKSMGERIDSLLSRYASMVGIREVNDIRRMKIKLVDPSNHVSGKTVRIGEAGGFIVPYTGEGIRPALESANELLSDILIYGGPGKNMRRLASVYRRHHRLYRVLAKLGPRRAAKAVLSMSSDQVMMLLEGKIGVGTIIKLAARSIF